MTIITIIKFVDLQISCLKKYETDIKIVNLTDLKFCGTEIYNSDQIIGFKLVNDEFKNKIDNCYSIQIYEGFYDEDPESEYYDFITIGDNEFITIIYDSTIIIPCNNKLVNSIYDINNTLQTILKVCKEQVDINIIMPEQVPDWKKIVTTNKIEIECGKLFAELEQIDKNNLDKKKELIANAFNEVKNFIFG